MKTKITWISLACGLLISSAATGQESSQGVSLATVRGTFRAADADGNGSISAREAARARIPGKHFVAHDLDTDRTLSQEEFVAYYRELLVKAGRAVGKDLEAEVARVEAMRRAKAAEQDQQRGAGGSEQAASGVVGQKTAEKLKAAQNSFAASSEKRGDGAKSERQQALQTLGDTGGDSLTTSEKLKRAKDALEGRWQGTGEPREKVQRAVDVLEERAAAAESRAPESATAEPAGVAPPSTRVAATQAEETKAVASSTDETAASDGLSDARRKLVERARNARSADTQGADATPAPPIERAREVLKRLVDGGRITPDQARDLAAVLAEGDSAATAGGATPIADQSALRATLRRAQAQVKGQLDSGAMTAEEARAVNDALVARARVISANLPAEEARASVPVEPESVRQETGQATVEPGTASEKLEPRPAGEQPPATRNEVPAKGPEAASGEGSRREAAERTEAPKGAEAGTKPTRKQPPVPVKDANTGDRKASEEKAEEQKNVPPPPVRDGGQDGGGRRGGEARDGGRRVGGY